MPNGPPPPVIGWPGGIRMKQHWKFFASAAAALVWLWVSAALAVPWVRGAALHLPFAYVVFVVAG